MSFYENIDFLMVPLPEQYNVNNVSNISLNDLYFFLPEAFFVFFLVFFLIFGVIYTNSRNVVNKKFYIIHNSLVNILFFFIIVFFLLCLNNCYCSYSIFNGFFISNPFSLTFKLIIILTFFLFLFCVKYYLKFINRFDYEFIIVMLFSLLSMLLILNSNDLLTLYLTIELQSLCFYVLVSSKQTSSFSTESGLKYFILGSFSSGLLLLGISFIYGFSGLLNFEDLAYFCYSLSNSSDNLSYVENGFLLGILFVTIALLFKLGVAPFHMWVPDVYEGAPMIITAFLSIVPKLAIIFIFIKLYFNIFFFYFNLWHYIFIVVAILSVIWGSIGAIYQIKIKRLFTYSMISNSGFFLLGISFGNIEGLQSTMLYLLIYIFLMLGIFICILSLREYNNLVLIKKLSLLINLYNINPVLALTFSLLLFSIAGIPPLVGFYSKFYLFLVSLGNSLYLVTLIFVIFSIVSIFYYVRLIKLMFFNKNKYWFFFYEVGRGNAIILGIIFFINILFFINPNIVFKFLYNISMFLYV